MALIRLSFVVSIGGFFVPNLLANFGVIPRFHPSIQAFNLCRVYVVRQERSSWQSHLT